MCCPQRGLVHYSGSSLHLTGDFLSPSGKRFYADTFIARYFNKLFKWDNFLLHSLFYFHYLKRSLQTTTQRKILHFKLNFLPVCLYDFVSRSWTWKAKHRSLMQSCFRINFGSALTQFKNSTRQKLTCGVNLTTLIYRLIHKSRAVGSTLIIMSKTSRGGKGDLNRRDMRTR